MSKTRATYRATLPWGEIFRFSYDPIQANAAIGIEDAEGNMIDTPYQTADTAGSP